jgi:hypothetical protein
MQRKATLLAAIRVVSSCLKILVQHLWQPARPRAGVKSLRVRAESNPSKSTRNVAQCSYRHNETHVVYGTRLPKGQKKCYRLHSEPHPRDARCFQDCLRYLSWTQTEVLQQLSLCGRRTTHPPVPATTIRLNRMKCGNLNLLRRSRILCGPNTKTPKQLTAMPGQRK